MKKVLLSLAFLLAFSYGAFAQIQLERTWQTFNSPKGDWSILSPGVMQPDEEARDPKSKMGSFGYRDSEGFFAVTWRDLPKVPKKLKEYYDKIFQRLPEGARNLHSNRNARPARADVFSQQKILFSSRRAARKSNPRRSDQQIYGFLYAQIVLSARCSDAFPQNF
jgi:hypothetical protein